MKYVDAYELHRKYFKGDFQICELRKGSYIKTVGDGHFATDGQTFVISQSAFLDLAKIKHTYVLSRADIKRLSNSMWITRITLAHPVDGLTKDSILTKLIKVLIVALLTLPTFGIALILALIWRKKIFAPSLRIKLERQLLGSYEYAPNDHLKTFNTFLDGVAKQISP